MNLFVPKDFKPNILEAIMQAVPNLEQKVKIIKDWQKAIREGKVDRASEQELQAEFLHKFFGQVLGYADDIHLAERNLRREVKTETDQTKPDGILGYFRFEHQHLPQLNDYFQHPQQFKDFQGFDVRAVIELKQALVSLDKPQRKPHFKGSPVEQGFSYIPKFGKQCKWVIISNFKEIRLYHHSDMNRSEVFEITQLLEGNNLAKFFFLLQKDRLFLEKQDSPVDILFAERRIAEEKITLDFYNEYSAIREVLFYHLRKNNPHENPFTLLSSTQKLLDRVIFMAFARDTIPTVNVIGDALKAEELLAYEQDDKLWHILKKLFRSYDKGFFDKVPNFNGGLFQKDEFLEEKIQLKDEHIRPLLLFVLKYDFQSELNVNILGHIFEQSITDLEQMRSEIANSYLPDLTENITTNLRKREGIFYTPDYITRYIVRHSVGAWLDERKEELLAKHQTENLAYWQEYSEVLHTIKVLDPACGSGAFLTQVFEYLWAEWKIVLAETTKLEANSKHPSNNGNGLGGMFEGINLNARQEWEVKKQIVQNNIYGVDLNMESVAISRLAMWLLTANKLVTLADLSPNIKQGNSLIDDPNIDEHAFDWKKEFPFEFDVVVGNPPYVYRNVSKKDNKKYYENNYIVSEGNYELYKFFIEKGLSLLKGKGKLSFITSASYLVQDSFFKLRRLIVTQHSVDFITLLGGNVFEKATVDTVVIGLTKRINPKQKIKVFLPSKPTDIEEELPFYTIQQARINRDNDYLFDYLLSDREFDLLRKIFTTFPKLEIGFEFGVGINTGYIKRELIANKKIDSRYHLMVKGNDISRYGIARASGWIMYDKDFIKSKKELGRSLPNEKFFNSEKILVIRTRNLSLKRRIIATIDDEKKYNLNRLSNIIAKEGYSLKGLLGILNSHLFQWIFSKKFFDYEIKPVYLRQCPMADVNDARLTALVNQIMSNTKSLEKLRADFVHLFPKQFKPQKISKRLENWFELDFDTFLNEIDKSKPARKIKDASFKERQKLKQDFDEVKKECEEYISESKEIERQIDQLVYQLYQLTPEEIAIVEDAK
jgi:type I restriction-modification system DNA methylase subunit